VAGARVGCEGVARTPRPGQAPPAAMHIRIDMYLSQRCNPKKSKNKKQKKNKKKTKKQQKKNARIILPSVQTDKFEGTISNPEHL
jgi:hypothetical protein